MSKTNGTERTRELTEGELDAVSGNRAFVANSSHTSMSGSGRSSEGCSPEVSVSKHPSSRRLQCMTPNLQTLSRKTRRAVRRGSFVVS